MHLDAIKIFPIKLISHIYINVCMVDFSDVKR